MIKKVFTLNGIYMLNHWRAKRAEATAVTPGPQNGLMTGTVPTMA